MGRWITALPGIAIVAACLLAAGCGSGSPSGSGATPSVTTGTLAFSKCMRAHGVPGFPDPGATLSGPFNAIGGIAFPASIDPQSPAFQTAMSSCRGLLSGVLSSHNKPQITAGQKAAMIAHAQCMRTHGVPNFPDPSFPSGGGIAISDPPGVNLQSPAYQQAQAQCSRQ
jgi:hypothetical protein